jgi:2-(1,2-epoxy-1,2-dihydrophenyl)acetyl-CoA isomerase
LTTGYIRRGLSPDAGVSYFLPRLVGASRAADLILTARDIRPDESDRIGLVSQVLSADNFAEEVASYADQLAGGPPLALTLAKRLLISSFDTDLSNQLKTELAFITRCFATQDVTEAMKAYLEKRQPNFKGR